MNKAKIAIATLLAGVPTLANAGLLPGHVPEPETLSLIAIGAVALIIAKTRKRK